MSEPEVYAMMADEDGTVTGYMCLVDWECEIGAASGGTTIHPSIEDLREQRKCVASCGIVEVKVAFSKVIRPPAPDPDAA